MIGSGGVRFALFLAYCVLTLAYLVWRALFTLNPSAPIYSFVFYVAEMVSICSAVVFYSYLRRLPRGEEPPAARPGFRIDVLIATYNEDVSLLRTTARAARDMDYPHNTWICDDGRREAVRELADELGVGYLARADNRDHKAGNLNHALGHTTGEIVLVLDADHVPRREFLTRTLGYFADATVAFVQTPQVYYNVDSYQHAASAKRRSMWHEAAIFHHRMQPGADWVNAAFFVGTGALLRRSALTAIGGFATGSITEDIHTSMRLHSKGYRSVYVNEVLGYMLAPDTPLAYFVQRLRWAQGSMQLLRRENPLFVRGLSVSQRIGYLNAMGVYLLSYQHLLFYVAPNIYLFTGVSPIAVDQPIALAVFVGYILFSLGLHKLLAAPFARLLLTECFKVLNLSTFVLASLTFLEPEGLRFKVTPKGQHGGLPLMLLAGPLSILLLSLTGAGIGLALLLIGTEIHREALVLTTFFTACFAIVAALVLSHTYMRLHTDEAFAFPVHIATHLEMDDRQVEVRINRMNHDVAYVNCDTRLPVGARTTLSLAPIGIDESAAGEVVGIEQIDRGCFVTKIQLSPLGDDSRDQLDLFFFEVALPRLFALFRDAPHGPPAMRGLAIGGDPVLAEEMLVPVRSGL